MRLIENVSSIDKNISIVTIRSPSSLIANRAEHDQVFLKAVP